MRRLSDVIRTEATLTACLERRKRELAVLSVLHELLPPALGAQTSVADASRPELVLLAGTGAAAALLRHRAPDLLERLAREGWKFTGIRIRVQARPAAADRSKVYAKQMEPAAAAVLRAAAARIEDPALAAALRRLSARAPRASQDKEQPLDGVEGEHAQKKK